MDRVVEHTVPERGFVVWHKKGSERTRIQPGAKQAVRAKFMDGSENENTRVRSVWHSVALVG